MRMTKAVNDKRPINLKLSSLKYPPMAIVSILHRISGIFLFLLLPFMLYFLSLSLRSEASFSEWQHLFSCPYTKGIVWVFGSALIFHLLAGIRHLFMDMGLGEQLSSGKYSALAVIYTALFLIIFLGFWLW